MATLIFWQAPQDKHPKKKGVVGGASWDQFKVNARAGHGKAFLVECANAEEGRAIIARGECQTRDNRVFWYGTTGEWAAS